MSKGKAAKRAEQHASYRSARAVAASRYLVPKKSTGRRANRRVGGLLVLLITAAILVITRLVLVASIATLVISLITILAIVATIGVILPVVASAVVRRTISTLTPVIGVGLRKGQLRAK